MWIPVALLLGLVMQPSAPMQPPQILFIAREPLQPGGEKEYWEIEEETARLSVQLGCPHPYLAAESLTGPKEIWWFNGFDSPEDEKQVAEAYAKNVPFSAALKKNSDRKTKVSGKPTEVTARYRPDFTSGTPWILGHGRFLVIAVSKGRPPGAGTVFEAADGTCFVIASAGTRKEAERISASLPDSRVFAIRPSISFPAKDWVAADRQFWRSRNPR